MSTPATTLESIAQVQKPEVDASKFAADLIVATSFFAATGALAGHLFSLITPMGGAAFGTAVGLSARLIAGALDQMFGSSTNEKTVKFVARFILTILVGVGATFALGIPLTFANGAYLALCMLPTALITAVAFGSIQKLVGN